MILILLLMFFLGCVQVPWALIQGLASRNPNVRRHFGFYGLGVLAYFAILIPVWDGLYKLDANPLLMVHFFGSAWLLACYHFWIVNLSITERSAQHEAHADPFVPTEAEV